MLLDARCCDADVFAVFADAPRRRRQRMLLLPATYAAASMMIPPYRLC